MTAGEKGFCFDCGARVPDPSSRNLIWTYMTGSEETYCDDCAACIRADLAEER